MENNNERLAVKDALNALRRARKNNRESLGEWLSVMRWVQEEHPSVNAKAVMNKACEELENN